jgi:hypothetical protein
MGFGRNPIAIQKCFDFSVLHGGGDEPQRLPRFVVFGNGKRAERR